MSSWLLENDGDDIISNVPFPQQLHKREKHQQWYRQAMSQAMYYHMQCKVLKHCTVYVSLSITVAFIIS